MSGTNIHIINLYEQGLSPEMICQAEGLELVAVKAILYNHCAKFREDIGQQKTLDFDDDQLERANRVMDRLMNSDDDHLAYKAAKYVRDDKKGRLDAKAGLKGLKGLNVTLINQQLIQAAQAVMPKQLQEPKPVDV